MVQFHRPTTSQQTNLKSGSKAHFTAKTLYFNNNNDMKCLKLNSKVLLINSHTHKIGPVHRPNFGSSLVIFWFMAETIPAMFTDNFVTFDASMFGSVNCICAFEFSELHNRFVGKLFLGISQAHNAIFS